MLPTIMTYMRQLSRFALLLPVLLASQALFAQSFVECKRLDQAQLSATSKEALLALRCRARQTSYEARSLQGKSQKFKDDLMFACLDAVDDAEHQLRVAYGFTREALDRQPCAYGRM